MEGITFIEVGSVPADFLHRLAQAVAARLGVASRVHTRELDPSFALISSRAQYNSTEILAGMIEMLPEPGGRMVGVTAVDLCVPILTFVFGEAQLGCCAAVVSLYRLRGEFYGLPADPELLFERALKETLHELGQALSRLRVRDALIHGRRGDRLEACRFLSDLR